MFIHSCKRTVGYWRFIPAMLFLVCLMFWILSYQLGNIFSLVIWTLACVFHLACIWLGHLPIPERWDDWVDRKLFT